MMCSLSANMAFPPFTRRTDINIRHKKCFEVEGLIVGCTMFGPNRNFYFRMIKLTLQGYFDFIDHNAILNTPIKMP